MNFIYRSFDQNNAEFNKVIGSNYRIVKKEISLEEFKIKFKDHFQCDFKENDPDSKCYAFLIYEDGKETIALFSDRRNFIMNDSGKTFSNITY